MHPDSEPSPDDVPSSECASDPLIRPQPPPRKWLRFSLRTLLFFVLMMGGGATLAWNWVPWQIACVIHEPTALHRAGFSPDGRYVYTVRKSPKNDNTGFENVVTLRDASTGGVFRTFRGGNCSGVVRFSPSGQYLGLLDDGGEYHMGVHFEQLWNVETGAPLTFDRYSPEKLCIGQISDTHVVFSEFKIDTSVEDPHLLARLQSDQAVPVREFFGYPHFSPNGKWLAYVNYRERALFIYSIDDGVESRIAIPRGDFYWSLSFTRDSSKVLLSQIGTLEEHQVLVYEVVSGRLVATHAGELPPDNPTSDDVLAVRCKDKSYLARIDAPDERVELDGSWIRNFSPDGRIAYGYSPLTAWDVKTGKKLWQPPNYGWLSPDGLYGFTRGLDGRATIVDARSGETLFMASERTEGTDMLDTGKHIELGPNGQFVSYAFSVKGFNEYSHSYMLGHLIDTDPADWKRVNVWRMRRPVAWWGVAWLPEFWLALFFAGAFVWSLVCDWRLLRAPPPL